MNTHWPFRPDDRTPSIFATDKAFTPQRIVCGKALTVVALRKRQPSPTPAQSISLPGSYAPIKRG